MEKSYDDFEAAV